VQQVENMMRADENRQHELLQRRLDARRNRRKAIQDELKQVDQKIRDNEIEKEKEQEIVLQKIQEEADIELKQLKEDEEAQLNALDEEFEDKKNERLISFQEKLKNARNDANFQQVLGEYQQA
jgi:uncharacterized protein (DUF342 family)